MPVPTPCRCKSAARSYSACARSTCDCADCTSAAALWLPRYCDTTSRTLSSRAVSSPARLASTPSCAERYRRHSVKSNTAALKFTPAWNVWNGPACSGMPGNGLPSSASMLKRWSASVAFPLACGKSPERATSRPCSLCATPRLARITCGFCEPRAETEPAGDSHQPPLFALRHAQVGENHLRVLFQREVHGVAQGERERSGVQIGRASCRERGEISRGARC